MPLSAPTAPHYDALSGAQQSSIRDFRETFVQVIRAKDTVSGLIDPTSSAHQAALLALFDCLVCSLLFFRVDFS